MKERFAAMLLAERSTRGGGDARRFPQPEMARLLDVSVRQYQRWEDPEDSALPFWRNVEAIGEKLHIDIASIFAEDEREELDGEAASTDQTELEAIRAELAAVRGEMAGLAREVRTATRLLRERGKAQISERQ